MSVDSPTLSSGSAGFVAGIGSFLSGSSGSIDVSSISVVSVPLDEGATGDGSGISLEVDFAGEAGFGERNWPVGSEDLPKLSNQSRYTPCWVERPVGMYWRFKGLRGSGRVRVRREG